MTANATTCGACGGIANDHAGHVSFYLKSGARTADVWRCPHCGTYIQDADFDSLEIRGHFEVASYTNPSELERWRRLRADFFVYLIDLAELHLGHSLQGRQCLDFGIAYGIMLDMFRERGARADGVETVPALRKSAQARGFVVHEDVYNLPRQAYDLITAVDSFYYIQDPERGLLSMRQAMKDDGLLLMRLANRTPYFNFRRRLRLPIHEKRFGDLKYFYTMAGVQALLSRTGFELQKVYWHDRGRRDPRFFESIYYKLSPMMNLLLTSKISPGMIILARPISQVPTT